MNYSALRIIGFSLAIAACGAAAFIKTRPNQATAPSSQRPSSPASSNLESFQFLGCSGDWTDHDMKAKVWLAGSKAKSTFLIKHPADCGYTIGTDPRAKILPNEIDFSYEMSNDSGALAACYCEYWVEFSLKSTPTRLSKITINGDEAELMSDLKQR